MVGPVPKNHRAGPRGNARVCPVCGSQRFFIKDPDDEYEIYPFESGKKGIVFDEVDPGEKALDRQTVFCDKCSRHGDLDLIKNP